MRDLLLGIDIGTTGTKAALFSFEGVLCGVGQKEYGLQHPHPGWAEQNPIEIWESVCMAVKMATHGKSGIHTRIAAVAVSSQGPTMLPLDRRWEPVRPALIWMDRRAEAEARRLEKNLGYEWIVEHTGNRPDPFYIAAKILWFRENEPDLFKRTRLFVQLNGYISFRLTGVHTLDNSQAALLQLRNWRDKSWSEEMCTLCGVEPSLFPPVHFGGYLQGEVTRDAHDQTGIPEGTPVVTGTVDSAAAAIEAGTVMPGVVSEMTGTSTVLIMPNKTGIVEPAFVAMPHALRDLDLLLGPIAATGVCLRWFRDEFAINEIREAEKSITEGSVIEPSVTDPYERITAEAARSPAGSGGVVFLPYMMGERSPIWHTQARGVFFGLSLSTRRCNFIRSILEGTVYALRHNLEVAKNAGLTVNEIRSIGGGSKSDLWNQIKADVLGVPVLLPRTSVGAVFGDAVLAGLGINVYKNVREFVTGAVSIEKEYIPDSHNTDFYSELYLLYRRIYESLKEDFNDAALLFSGRPIDP